MTPTCPTGYDCKFTPKNLHPHYWVHWWDGPWGIVVAGAALIALCVIAAILAAAWQDIKSQKLSTAERREERASKLAIEEQHTMQADAAKGDPEMLKVIREMQR